MSIDLPTWFIQWFAAPRLAPYVRAAQKEGVSVRSLYVWNLEVAAAFYVPLHFLEVSLRNALHEQLAGKYQRPDWWAVAPLDKHDETMIEKATADLRRQGVRQPTADHIVAALTFGFWLSLLSKRYDRHFWVPMLHKAFPHYHKDRATLHDNIRAMVLLRNRIMHHEPIHHRHLQKDHEKICLLLSYLGPELLIWLQTIDKVPATLARRPKAESHA
ncbi:hypothetical protein ACFYT3_09405 [Nocardia amikacinitolerans]|uniref:hypothetical protein n=1 Tax=Nocardia amikacinitolerans TaxID=756689 RepID=UPI0020A441CA|nr:hypothetical protein [Nocardia amikacinitolerans]MCP2290297.1 Abi-like protein [Nocardia amikacinitolerans]